MNMDNVIQPIYLVSAGLFVLSLMWMNHPSTARRGVISGVVAMIAAIGGTLLLPEIHYWHWIAIGVVAGTVLGVPLAMVPLTAVPQRTALSHAFGGLAAGLVGARGVLFGDHRQTSAAHQVRHRRPCRRGDLGLSHVYRQLDGGRQAPRGDPHPADHVQGPKCDESLAPRRCRSGRRAAGGPSDLVAGCSRSLSCSPWRSACC